MHLVFFPPHLAYGRGWSYPSAGSFGSNYGYQQQQQQQYQTAAGYGEGEGGWEREVGMVLSHESTVLPAVFPRARGLL